MGSFQLSEMIEHGGPDLALIWHLESNHFPPVHRDFLPAIKKAIRSVDRMRGDLKITLPNGNVFRADEIIEKLHLWPFLESREEY